MKQLKIEAIVPAAGQGVRLKSPISKPLVYINNYPLILYALKILNSHKQIHKIIVLSKEADLSKIKNLVNSYKIKKVKYIALGGATRKASVEKGLKLLDKDTDFVLIHDGARPFITEEIIERVVLKAKEFDAAICAVPVKSTIKRIKVGRKNIFVDKTIDRKYLWEVQTPQIFKKKLIIEAHQKFKGVDATDDACLVEKLGRKISIVEGSYLNIKITTPEDLMFAETILKLKKIKYKF
jgi:2-C-methyl-D-erythritol 4-phosphate cytidylyltransferase